jgi:hypothetical protein
VKKWLKGKKIRDSGVNPYVIRTASRILSAEHQKLNSSGRIMYINHKTKNKKSQIIICQPPLNQCRAR